MRLHAENENRHQQGQAAAADQESRLRRGMLHACSQRPDNGELSFIGVQIDLAVEPRRRSEMLAASDGVSSLPQLHLNNKYLGDWDTLQDMEDFGELDTALKAPHSS